MNQAEVVEVLSSRASSYAFVARAYREEPTLEFLNALASMSPETLSQTGNQKLVRFVRQLEKAEPDHICTELAAEYTALFLNAGKRPVYPFESVYTSTEKLLMQRAYDEVLKEYRRAGLERAASFNEPEDHIALELEFMSNLCRRTIEALRSGNKAAALEALQWQKDFLNKHLLVWIPQFCRDVEKSTQSDFYQAIALLTVELLKSEQETIPALVAEIQAG